MTLTAAVMFGATIIAAVMVVAQRHQASAASTGDALLRWQLMPIAVLGLGVFVSSIPGAFPLACSLAAAFVIVGLDYIDPVIDRGRSFYGVSRVTENSAERI